jgi:undecaprenyl phosphate N,N'-diacetylbacillosamine 1-phosphate transferase
MFYQKYFKRILDLLFSLVLIILTFPMVIIISIILYFANQGKVFFIQPRPGKNEKIFFIIKFRTMNDKKDEEGLLLPDGERLTYVGNFIRRTSIDEIPQLINVLKGDISLVGPRPLLVDYLPLYNDFQSRRHNVKPGITGWAQINGRNAITWDEKFKLDVWYVENLSLVLDVKILLLTIIKVFRSEGVNSNDSATMVRFLGNN